MKVLRRICLLVLMVLFLTSELTYAQNPTEESYYRGVEYAVQGKFQKAKEEFEKALKIDPFYISAELSLKTIEDVLEQKIKREVAVHLFRGVSYAIKGQYDEVISSCTKTIEINPKYADAYNLRGDAYYNKGLYDQAIRDFNKALEINPKLAAAYNNRGVVYRHKGQYDQAIRDFTKALEVNQKYAEAYYNRGFTYLVKLGNKVKGCADWKKACELGKCGNYNFAKQSGDCP